MTPATVSARRPRGSPWVWRPLRSRERCGKSPHRVALATPLDDHVVNRRPLSRDRQPGSSGSRRAPVPESPIIAANCGFSLEGATLPAPTKGALQVKRNPAASRRPHGHPLLAPHARGRCGEFRTCSRTLFRVPYERSRRLGVGRLGSAREPTGGEASAQAQPRPTRPRQSFPYRVCEDLRQQVQCRAPPDLDVHLASTSPATPGSVRDHLQLDHVGLQACH